MSRWWAWLVWAHMATDVGMALDGTLTQACVAYGYDSQARVFAKADAEMLRVLAE